MKNHRSARSKFNQAQVTASERAVSTEVPAIDVADTSRGSKRGAEEFRSVEDGEGQKGSTPPVRGSEINNMDEEAADVLDGDIAAIQGDVEIVKRNEVRVRTVGRAVLCCAVLSVTIARSLFSAVRVSS